MAAIALGPDLARTEQPAPDLATAFGDLVAALGDADWTAFETTATALGLDAARRAAPGEARAIEMADCALGMLGIAPFWDLKSKAKQYAILRFASDPVASGHFTDTGRAYPYRCTFRGTFDGQCGVVASRDLSHLSVTLMFSEADMRRAFETTLSNEPFDVDHYLALTIGAAGRLGVEQSTVSRRLAGLEKRLGRELFVRAPRGLLPTPLAERLRPAIDQARGALSAAAEVLASNDQPSGFVRVAMPEAFAQYIIAPRLPALQARFPKIELAIDDGPDLVDLARMEAHLAVRVPRPESGDIVARRFMEDSIALYGTASYLDGRAPEQLTLLGWDTTHGHLPEARLLDSIDHGGPILRFRRMTTMVEAARHGAGVALIGGLLARQVGLVRAPLDTSPARSPLWLAAPKALRDTPTVSALWDWFEELGTEARHIAGSDAL